MKKKTAVIAFCALLSVFPAHAKMYECHKSLTESDYETREWGVSAEVNLKADNTSIEVRPVVRYVTAFQAKLKFDVGFNDRIRYKGESESGSTKIVLLTTPDKNGILGIKVIRKQNTNLIFTECKRTDTTEYDNLLTKF